MFNIFVCRCCPIYDAHYKPLYWTYIIRILPPSLYSCILNACIMVSTASPTTSALRLDFLRDCLSKAQQLKDLIGVSLVPEVAPPSLTYNGPIPDLDLPFPHDILLSIDDMGLHKHLSKQIKSKITEKILQSQRACINIYQQTCHDLPERLISSEYLTSLAKMYRNFYNDHQIADFRTKISTSKATLNMVNKNHILETKKSTFNSVSTLMLPHVAYWLNFI